MKETLPTGLADVDVGRFPALHRLRTVEFRLTLRGYHIDDVDAYLDQVAAEMDVLAPNSIRDARITSTGWENPTPNLSTAQRSAPPR